MNRALLDFLVELGYSGQIKGKHSWIALTHLDETKLIYKLGYGGYGIIFTPEMVESITIIKGRVIVNLI